MQAAWSMVVVSCVGKITIKVASKFGSYSIRAVVVSCVEGARGSSYFSDAAEVVTCVVIESGVTAADALFPFAVVSSQNCSSICGTLFGGLVVASPEVALVAGDGVASVFFDDADSLGETVVGELGGAAVGVSDFHQAIFRIPLVASLAVCEGVSVKVIIQ